MKPSNLLVQDIGKDRKKDFKAACAKRNKTMKKLIIDFMDKTIEQSNRPEEKTGLDRP